MSNDKASRDLTRAFGDIINGDPSLRKLFAGFAKSEDERMRKRAKEKPVENRLTMCMEGHAGYSYFQTYNGRGSKVRFCYSTNRNAAGYFLVWREVITAKQLKRDQWDSSTSKASAVNTAKDMHERFKAKVEAAKITDMPTRFELEMEMDAPLRKQRRNRTRAPKGYAALPGTGPAGETCKTCQH